MNIPVNLGKTLLFLTIIGLAGCKKTKTQPSANRVSLAGAHSILVNNGNVLVSGFRNENNRISTQYWINGKIADPSGFTELVGNQSAYRQAIDEQYRNVYTFKDLNGGIQNYQFDQGSLIKGGKIFYYKNNSLVTMDNDSIGTLSSVDVHNGKSYFAGSIGKITSSEAGNTLRPEKAFVWDGNSAMTLLPFPKRTLWFQGVSTIYVQSSDEVYVGCRCGIPMYWQNNEPIILDEHYGEVWQITTSGPDVYAVGLINKHNSNSAKHTACYWKNGKLQELEDNAQAFGIFVSGADIYISGAIGDVPVHYKPCYWKNGVRVDLPM